VAITPLQYCGNFFINSRLLLFWCCYAVCCIILGGKVLTSLLRVRIGEVLSAEKTIQVSQRRRYLTLRFYSNSAEQMQSYI